MESAQFEEKEYEALLYHQLPTGSQPPWAPGQVLEYYLGFDRGLLLGPSFLWGLHGHPGPLPGVSPFGDLWPALGAPPPDRDRLPSFALNLFIQAKRPDIGKRLTKVLKQKGLGSPFYRFQINPEQQLTLSAVASALVGRALFVYAAPVFGSSSELFRHTQAGTLASHSTFPNVDLFAGHKAWYYSQPGATGLVNDSYNRVDDPPLAERVESMLQEHYTPTGERRRTPLENLAELARGLRQVIQETPSLGISPRVAYLTNEWRRIASLTRSLGLEPTIRYYFEVDAFTRYFSLRWLVIDDGARHRQG